MIKKIATPQLRADVTRKKILKAARNLFIELGFAGTSMGQIAVKAKVNHSLIFHHFANKAGLWKAVKQSIVEEANKLYPTIPELDSSFANFLEKLIKQNIMFYRQHSDIVRMMNWQRLEFKSKKDIGVTLSTEANRWLQALSHYQTKGQISGKLKLEFVLTFILSIISSAAMDPNAFIKEKSDLDAYIYFIVQRLLIGLK